MLNFVTNYINKVLNSKTKVSDKNIELFQENYKEAMVKINSQTVCSTEIASMEDLLETSLKEGLSSKEVSHRQRLYGGNDFDIGEETPLWKKYLFMFKEPMIILLLVSGFVSICMGQYDDAVSITVAVIIVVTVAFIQEYRSDQSVAAITKLVPPTCYCLRDGQWIDFLAEKLVPGDIIAIETGDRVPADIRLFESLHLQIDESSFTGEIKPAKKHTGLLSPNCSLSERNNIALMGTLVSSGKGKGIVFGTGVDSEFGSVFQMMKEEEPPKTPLQKSMDQLGAQLSTYSILIIGFVVFLGWIQKRRIVEMFTIGVSLAVAAIPEGLPIVVTVTLALGVMRMARKNAIVKRLPVVETLGCATVICSDKTGTLTKNEMTVTDLVLPDNRKARVTGIGYSGHGEVMLNGEAASEFTDTSLTQLIKTGCLCNNASIKNGSLHGQATEGAIISVGLKMGFVRLHEENTRIEEIPFMSETKWMAVKTKRTFAFGNEEQEEIYHVKGAVERVLDKCKTLFQDGSSAYMTTNKKQEISNSAHELGERGLRVIAFAYGKDLSNLTYLGLAGIIDPPRRGVHEAIRVLQESGVQVKMITGDAKDTAVAVGHSIGIDVEKRNVISGEQLESMDVYELKRVINEISIFYRVSPRNKVTVVKALQELGHVVGMTGDGVNDAVALKCADIGIAMGKCGTDVSKEAADMILADDDFGTIMAALIEGKGIYYNIRNFVRFQLSTSIAAIALIMISTLMKLPNPLNAMQILWINIIMDGPPAQSLGVEPVDNDIMKRKPRSVRSPMINTYLVVQVLTSATVIVLGTLFIFWREMADNIVTPRDTTMTFTCFVFFDMFNAMSCRSQTKSIFQIGFFTNKTFLYAVLGSLIGQSLVVYFPPLQAIFQTEALGFFDICLLVSLASTVLVLDEIRKLIRRKQKRDLLPYSNKMNIV